MQKVIQRAKHAQHKAQVRLSKIKQTQEVGERWNLREETTRYNRSILQTEKEARKNRKEDWDAGPLAPRREVGEKAVTFGTFPINLVNPPDVAPENKTKWQSLVEGDRVVIARGRDKGRIGKISDYTEDKETCKVEGLNMIDVHMPAWLQREQEHDREVAPFAQGVPIENLRLVYALRDPKTGVYRDTVVDRLECVGRKFNKDSREWDRGHRIIPGTKTIIPWPIKAESEETTNVPADTPRLSVDEVTFEPYLLAPPMPLSVIDELRNKYSKFRTQHDYDYIMKKELEEVKTEKRKDLAKTMQTPLQELAALRAREKEAPSLTMEQLAKIGEVIAQERVKVAGAIRKEHR